MEEWLELLIAQEFHSADVKTVYPKSITDVLGSSDRAFKDIAPFPLMS
jgi:hypothetical protein